MKILLTFASFCISIGCFCQNGDYLVKNNGDTIWGEVNLKHNIFYVTGITETAISAKDVNKIKSRKYKGNTVLFCTLELYTDNLAYMELDYIVKGKTDTVLILDEIYVSPKINLYFVKSEFKVPFYFYKTPADPKPIQLIIHYSMEGGNTSKNLVIDRFNARFSSMRLVENKAYVNQLYGIMGNCKNIPQTMWDMLSYRDYSLKQLFKKFNKCK